MATFNKFLPFSEAVYEKVHNLGADQITVALTNAANAPVNTYATLSQLTQIAYTNLSTRNVTTASSAQTAGTYKLTLTDLVLTASSGAVAAFRYVILYNDTSASDNLIGWYDYGVDQVLNDTETFTIDFDGTNGCLTHA